MNYRILEMDESSLIFECNINGLDMEVRVNCEIDENHYDGSGYETVNLTCPRIPVEEISVKRFVRDFGVLGIKAIRVYEERYAAIKQQTEDSFLDD